MNSLPAPFFLHLKQVLDFEDISSLRLAYSRNSYAYGLPCYAFIRQLLSPVHRKIQDLLSSALSEDTFYLNDFFFYTGSQFSTPWHVDTELFLFERAVNAWILLEPTSIDDPLGIIPSLNTDNSAQFYHSFQQESDVCIFVDYLNTDLLELNCDALEASCIHTGNISVGDILIFDPSLFHRTNTSVPKGACVFKYILGSSDSPIRSSHLPEVMWPELSLYKKLYGDSRDWSEFLSRVEDEITKRHDQSPLVSGFYPDNFDYLNEKARSLTDCL